MAASESYYPNYLTEYQVIYLLDKKILYLEGAFAALGAKSCLKSGRITYESTLCAHIENLILWCRQFPEVIRTRSASEYDVDSLQEFVKLTKPEISHAALNQQNMLAVSIVAPSDWLDN